MKNLSVKTRMAGGFGILLVLLVIISILGVVSLNKLRSGLTEIVYVNSVQSTLAVELRLSLLDRALAVRNLALLSDLPSMRIEADRIRTQERLYADAYQKLGKILDDDVETSPKERALFASLKEAEAAALPLFKQVEELGLANKPEEATTLLMGALRTKQRAWLALLKEMQAIEEQANRDSGEEASGMAETSSKVIMAAALAAIAFALATGVWVARSILNQLGGEPSLAQDVARQIADGNLQVDVPLQDGSDSLMASLESMRKQLNGIVSGIKSSANSIAVAAAEIAEGNADLSQRTEEQASSLEETASSMEELTSTVKQNAQNAVNGDNLVRNASGIAVAGGEVVQRVVTSMSDISRSSTKITEIIAVIEGIAFQTNILALNAAVEAARAGEQGRGFAVVASEVRNLAQRSAGAAKEIKMLIDDSVEKVGAGTKLVGQAGVTMDEVVASVRRVTDIMSEIANASQEQSAGIEQVNLSIIEMDSMTQQNAALVEESAAAAQSLQDQASELSRVVSIFKLVEGEERVAAPVFTPAPKAVVKPIAAVRAPVRKLAAKPAAPAAKPKKVVNAPSSNAADEWEEF
ncbi:MAG TPA: methyl-accepting chemotaxis protein [Duganella sp.]|nr:methyl-accepting chemotaxis protein [Duganella sp.]